MRLRQRFNKDRSKRLAGRCLFCGEPDLDLVDVHRIHEGADGGQYNDRNTVVCCALCHRKIHSGRIVVEGKYFTTAGKWVVYYNEDGVARVV